MAPITLDGSTSTQALLSAYEHAGEDWRRDHLGASVLGHGCDRYLWLSFRWAHDPKHPGQLKRLFERGNREEAWIIEDLRRAGFEVIDRDPATGEQWVVRWGHVGGSLDGVVRGLLEAPKTDHVLEVKTFNRKSFEWLTKNGVKRAKPEHFTQMQVYMRGRKLERAFYVAVCKDDDSIHQERVDLDREFADKAIARGQSIVAATEPAARLNPDSPPCVLVSKDGTRWPCQFFDLCHGEAFPEPSCRTCISATPWPDGSWICAHHRRVLDGGAQRAACRDRLAIPAAVNAQVVEVSEEKRRVIYQFASGQRLVDGGMAV